MGKRNIVLAAALASGTLVGCGGGDSSSSALVGSSQSCMSCHNGSPDDDYRGPGIENPHPFGTGPEAQLLCTDCHGGNPNGADRVASHVPAPPQIGGATKQEHDRFAYFNRLTLTGIDKLPDYVVDGVTYSALDYLQFINPGDLRVVDDGRSCGACHEDHVEGVGASMLATAAGMLSGAMYAAGADNEVPASQGLYQDTAADKGFRSVSDPSWSFDPANVGAVSELIEYPVFSTFGGNGPNDIFRNDLYVAAGLADDVHADGRVVSGSPLANLYHEQVAFTCGDCHLGSAGANNRYGDFRSSGCTACHMRYSLDGRSGTSDPNVNKLEPADPDEIQAPERAHVARHLIRSTARTSPTGKTIKGIDDYSCAGCHQGSNRTVMQYWGIRLDQNQDVRRNFQYPANPASYKNTAQDERLFDPVVGNHTFNGRNANQYLLREDYDGDGRDDTPPDVHYEAGLGCIDCHGSYDLHGGDVANGDGGEIKSRMGQAVAIRCESCHGGVDAYAPTQAGTAHDGQAAELALDAAGNVLDHVVKEGSGYFLYSRLTGKRHYVAQTRDVVVDTGVVNPLTQEAVYSALGSFAMGRDDGDPATGLGPQQTGTVHDGFSHDDNVSCVACHASWTNSCIGCHLEGEYSENPNNFSNITGERIAFREDNALFTYQSPVFFQLGVDPRNEIAPIAPNTEMFFSYKDRHNALSDTFAFSDRNGTGNDKTATPFPALSHNAMMPHSIRGRVTSSEEGPRYCVACHLTDGALSAYGEEYDDFRAAIATDDFASLDFDQLKLHFGQNTGNQLDSPLWVHMVAGLGTGLFLFDEHGRPINPLDQNDNRAGCDESPADTFNLANVAFNLDRIVDQNGASQGSSNHPMLAPGQGPNLRDGGANTDMAGPLGSALIDVLTNPATGIVLDSWVDADGTPRGDAVPLIGGGN